MSRTDSSGQDGLPTTCLRCGLHAGAVKAGVLCEPPYGSSHDLAEHPATPTEETHPASPSCSPRSCGQNPSTEETAEVADEGREAWSAVLYDHREDALTCYDHPEAYCCVCGEHEVGGYRAHLATILAALTANAKAEAETLQAEVAHWKAHAEEAGEGFSRVCLNYARVAAARTAAEAEVDDLRALHRDLASRLGFGDNITEPMADNDTIVAWFEQQNRDASEWHESQLWRNDCHAAGHRDDEDCLEHDPALRLLNAETERDDLRARLAKVEALVPCLCSPKSFAASKGHHFPACPRAALANPDAAGEGKP